MLKKMAALVALAAGLALGTGAAAVADPYSPQLPTQTQIEIVVTAPDKPIQVRVSASANDPTPPKGLISVEINATGSGDVAARSSAAAPVFTTTVRFEGSEVSTAGPVLPRGRYVADASFSPDDKALYLPSSNSTAFRVSGAAVPGPGAGDDAGAGSGLPNTGGPDLLWLLLGGALVLGGAGVATYGRRRQALA